MLNNKLQNTLKIDTTTGSICKTYRESWFTRFYLDSSLADKLFDSNSNIIILQMILCGDNQVIGELICKKDFDKYFEEKGEGRLNDNSTSN